MVFLYSCAVVDKISTDKVSRGPSAIAEPFVVIGFYNNLHCHTSRDMSSRL